MMFILYVVGCSGGKTANLDKPDYSGYVLDKKEEEILVVSSEAKDVNDNGNADYYSALWGSHAPNSVEVGDQVEVWVDGGVDESYPAQAKIGEINVVSNKKPTEAKLTEAEAIRRALNKIEKTKRVPVVKSTNYSEEKDSWIIRIIVREVEENSISNIKVKDE